jgi:hypothetical protein
MREEKKRSISCFETEFRIRMDPHLELQDPDLDPKGKNDPTKIEKSKEI